MKKTSVEASIISEKEEELAIEMFGVLFEEQEARAGSRNPNYSSRERNRLDKKAEALRKKFLMLEKQAEGEPVTRNKLKGEAYSLAAFYLSKYPEGSLTVSKAGIPSMMAFAKTLEGLDGDDRITTCSGPLEIEYVAQSDYILMGLNGESIKEFKLDNALRVGFKRAKTDLNN